MFSGGQFRESLVAVKIEILFVMKRIAGLISYD